MKDYIKYLVLIFILFLIIAIPIVLYFVSRTHVNTQKIDNPIAVNNLKEKESTVVKESELEKIIDENFNNNDDYAVVIKNLESGEEYKYNAKKEFYSASLYKLWVLGAAMKQIDNGTLDKEGLVSGDKKKLDKILNPLTPTPTTEGVESEKEEKEEPDPISFTVEDAIKKMITKSDNYAALLISQKVGNKEIGSFLDQYNFVNSSFGSPPKTNAEDIANYFELLYEGKIINGDISSEMIDILKQQELDDRIPKYLPEEIEVAHKTGELLGNKHDAGIVYAPKGDYIIVVLSKTQSESKAAEKIAKFSEDVYNYFEKN